MSDDPMIRAERARVEAEVQAIRATSLVLESVAMSAEFALASPVDMELGGQQVSVMAVRVTVERSTQKPAPDEDPGPHRSVRILAHPLTARGELSKRERASWMYATSELAEYLLGHGFGMYWLSPL